MEDVLKVDEYLFLYKEGSLNSKKLKKKFVKKKISHLFVSQLYKESFEKESLDILLKYLTRVKKNIKKDTKCIGVLSDDNILIDNILILPPQPQSWDILFLECDIKAYTSQNKYNTVYWYGIKGVNDSRNFVINVKSIDKIISLVQKSKEWIDFINNLEELDNMFTIVKTFLSRRENEYIFSDVITKKTSQEEKDKIINTYNDKISNKLLNDNINFVNYNKMSGLYDERTSDFTYEEKYIMLPCISLICVISNIDLFIHSLYTFLKLDYPRDKLEFLIIDDNDYEKSIKKLLPEDGRIKIINLTKKNNENDAKVNGNMDIPLGNKLNMGVKYAKYDLICHFFDTNIYLPDTFMNLIKCYIVSNKDALVSGDMAIYEKETGKSVIVKKSDLGNMIYTKNFWKACTFIDIENNKDVLFYNFTFFRKSCISYIPFLHYSFRYTKDTKDTNYKSSKEISFSLDKLVNNSVKESFLII